MRASRRAFLSSLPAAAIALGAEKFPVLPSEAVRYADPATEFTVYRLTDPKHTSFLPASYSRAVSRKGTFLLCSNDRSGSFQPYRLEIKTGLWRQLAATEDLATASLCLLPDEKSCVFFAARTLWQVNFATLHQREVCGVESGNELAGGVSVSEDGLYAAFVERAGGRHRLRLVNVAKGAVTTLAESDEAMAEASIRPKRAGVLYRLGGRALHIVSFDATQNQRLRTPSGGLGPALWSDDGRAVDYLNFPEDRKQLNSVREYAADANEDRFVAGTSQFVQFGRNGDSTVFVGASGSKASPYVLLLVRAAKRELTLCEHKASDAVRVAPIFSPNSQRVFFQTDRHGKWAIYSMAVDRLVDETA